MIAKTRDHAGERGDAAKESLVTFSLLGLMQHQVLADAVWSPRPWRGRRGRSSRQENTDNTNHHHQDASSSSTLLLQYIHTATTSVAIIATTSPTRSMNDDKPGLGGAASASDIALRTIQGISSLPEARGVLILGFPGTRPGLHEPAGGRAVRRRSTPMPLPFSLSSPSLASLSKCLC